MDRKCAYCDSPLPDSVRGTFCDDDCEVKFEREHAGDERDYQRSMTGYLKDKLW